MTLSALFTSAILSLAPSLPPETATRYASDIALAVGDDLELGLMLVVTAKAEADFREDIERCNCKRWECDADKNGNPLALSLFQLHFYWWDGHEPEEICASNTLATALAAREFRIHRTMVGGDTLKALRRHVGHLVDPNDRRVIERPKNFLRLMAAARKALAS